MKTNYRFLCWLTIIGVCFPVITYGGGAGERSRSDTYGGSIPQEPRPIWIKQQLRYEDVVRFVGRSDSDKIIKNGSYPEMKGDAYRGVRVESDRKNYVMGGDDGGYKSEVQDVSKISADIIDSASDT